MAKEQFYLAFAVGQSRLCLVGVYLRELERDARVGKEDTGLIQTCLQVYFSRDALKLNAVFVLPSTSFSVLMEKRTFSSLR